MELKVDPLIALCNVRVNISVTDLPSFGKVKISASMNLSWAENVRYESFAWFTADSNGNLDLSMQKPDSGSYNFTDSMGLIMSLKRVKGKFEEVAQNISVNKSLFIYITAECGEDKSSVRLERLFMYPGVKNLKINDEFFGELFYTEDKNNKTIILLGGSSNKDLSSILPPSALLASQGFNVLALAFYGEKGFNSALAEIPLEYFEKVFTWLEKNPITKHKTIYTYGGSIGSVLALLLASRYPNIKKVIAVNPFAWCIQGLTFRKVSLFTYSGKSLPFIKISLLSLLKDVINCFIKNKPFGFAYTYKKSLEFAKNKEEARIKVENSEADILLFGGQKDGWWDTHDACLKIIDELVKHNYQYNYEYITYENGGHACYPPFVIPFHELSAPLKLAPRLVFSEGVTWESNAYMLDDSWRRTIEFFKK